MSQVHFQRGLLLYQQGRYADAVGELRLQLAHEEDNVTHGILALALAELEQFDDATTHAHRAIELAPDEAYGHYALCRVLINRRRFAEAKQAILEAIRLSPYDADYFGMLANLELLAGRWRETLEAANRGLAIEPEHGLCTNLRAQALVHLGDRTAAAATMGEALARRPDDSFTHANQGWALLHAGKPREAAEHFREALRLDPQMEWARAGIVEALKARNFVYRWMLAFILWMSRMSSGARWALIFGAYFGSRFIRQWADRSPQLGPVLWPLLYLYYAFVLMTWLAPSLFNLLLRLDRFGKHVLSPDERMGANLLAGCLGAAIACLLTAFATGQAFLVYVTLMLVLLALPVSAIYVCDAGWPRNTMAAISAGLLAAVIFVAITGLWEKQMPASIVDIALPMVSLLPLAMLASQFAAMYLMQAKPTR